MAREYIPKDFVKRLKHELEHYYTTRCQIEEALINIRVNLLKLQNAGVKVTVRQNDDGSEEVFIKLPPPDPVKSRMIDAALQAAWRSAQEVFQPFIDNGGKE